MNRFIPWWELLIYCPIGLSFLAASLCTATTGSIFFAHWAITTLVLFICAFCVIIRWTSPPDYITQQRVSVWSDIRERNFILPTLTDLESLLDSFCEHTLIAVKSTPDLLPAERAITREQLRRMLIGAKFLFTKRTSALRGVEWQVRERTCSQRRKLAAIRYFTPFTTTGIFVALWHMIDSEILHRPADPRHTNTLWWKVLEDVRARVENDIFNIFVS